MKQIIFGFFILIFALGILYFVKNYTKFFKKNGTFALVNRVSVTPTLDTATIIFRNSVFSFSYPQNWYIYQYPARMGCLDMSDIQNPQDVPIKIKPDSHTIFQICTINGPLPSSFPYTNGSSINPTIKTITVNGYLGISGQQKANLGIEDIVYLTNPKGGHVEIRRELGSPTPFNKILSTFMFLK